MSLIRKFILSCVIILLLTGIAKIWSAFGESKILELNDPVFEVRFRSLFLSVGLLEIAAAMICLFVRRRVIGLIIINWLASCFIVYRATLHWIGWEHHCPCLGSLTDALHIPPQTADTAMKIILAYLLLGSYTTLFWLWRQKCKKVPSASAQSTPP